MDRLFRLEIDNNQIGFKYNYNPGHTFGQGLISPDRKFNFVLISKNSSSSIQDVLRDWQPSNYHEISRSVQHLVILRDPTERWISGIAEFLVGNFSFMGNQNADVPIEEIESIMETRIFQNLLFNFVIFDGHTIPQCCYLEGLNLSDVTFFYQDKDVMSKILYYVGEYGKPIKFSNEGSTNVKKLFIMEKLRYLLENDRTLQKKIDIHFYADHQLFDQVTFFNQELS